MSPTVERPLRLSAGRWPSSAVESMESNIMKSARDSEESLADPNYAEPKVQEDDDSPYPEVRIAVANTDDPSIPVDTVRAWCLGLFWAILLPGINQFFFFRYPAITINSLVAQLLSYPLGRAWAHFVPNVSIFGVPLNPGPFTMKEHVLITVMANVGSISAYATDIIAVQRVYYGQNQGFLYQWMIVLSTQMIGFSIGGIGKRFLVSPPSMIWPTNLVLCALFNTLHSQHLPGIPKHGISRERFFLYVFIGGTAYHFIPGYLFTALSFFSWVCWIKPENVVVNQLFGYASGLGMSAITFDWSQIAYIGSPLATPWWAEANIFFGFVVFYWILTPILYYSNVWYSKYLPILSAGSYDNTGNIYDVTRILTPENTMDLEKYHAYSPLFISTTFAMSYGLSFASITATVVHAFLFHRKQLWIQARRSLNEQPDIHARLMSKYKPVPDWWYITIFVTMFTFGVIVVEVFHNQLPVWALMLALAIAFFYVIPIGIIQAITNQQIGLNVITELIFGYILPGRPIGLMMFKTYGYITMSQALTFTSDLKLGHYMKVPPRSMFWCQVIATAVAGTVQLGVQSWMFSNIDDLCSIHQVHGFTCPNTRVFFTASVVWGVIGPGLQFSSGRVYNALLWFFLLGAIAPIIPWVAARKYPNGFAKYVSVPVILSGTAYIPPATAVNYVPWAIVGFIFQYVIRRRYFSWWARYNYVLSAALDSSVAVGTILIFFILQYPKDGAIGLNSIQNWWGNTVYTRTADWQGVPMLRPEEGKTFGPSSW